MLGGIVADIELDLEPEAAAARAAACDEEVSRCDEGVSRSRTAARRNLAAAAWPITVRLLTP